MKETENTKRQKLKPATTKTEEKHMQIVERIRRSKRVYLIGNGGSAANAQHICNDLLSVGIRAFTLDPATLTATANDYSYSEVFSRWIKTVGEKGDLLIALSGSGRSENIVKAIKAAKKKKMDTYLLTWYLKPPMDMQMSEEAQLVIGHNWMRSLRGNKRR